MRRLVLIAIVVLALAGCGGEDPEFNRDAARSYYLRQGDPNMAVEARLDLVEKACSSDQDMLAALVVAETVSSATTPFEERAGVYLAACPEQFQAGVDLGRELGSALD